MRDHRSGKFNLSLRPWDSMITKQNIHLKMILTYFWVASSLMFVLKLFGMIFVLCTLCFSLQFEKIFIFSFLSIIWFSICQNKNQEIFIQQYMLGLLDNFVLLPYKDLSDWYILPFGRKTATIKLFYLFYKCNKRVP